MPTKREIAPPFLEILTRCYKRPQMLMLSQASLVMQTDPDWVQTLLPDRVGRGVAWANQRMRREGPRLVGEYIWVLDDDDTCICPTLVADLKTIVETHGPDVVMVQMDHGERGVLPPAEHWGHRNLGAGFVGVSAPIVRRKVWQEHAWAWGDHYAGDHDFISALLAGATVRIYWHRCIASKVQQISKGAPEE
jgi:hypothetical protein